MFEQIDNVEDETLAALCMCILFTVWCIVYFYFHLLLPVALLDEDGVALLVLPLHPLHGLVGGHVHAELLHQGHSDGRLLLAPDTGSPCCGGPPAPAWGRGRRRGRGRRPAACPPSACVSASAPAPPPPWPPPPHPHIARC